jgi:hypothetical protein
MKRNGNAAGEKRTSIASDLIKGAIAGAVGTWAIGKVTNYMYEHEDPAARQTYERVTGGKYVPDRTAEKIEKALGLNLSEEQRGLLAEGSHWGLGIGAGATYALLRRRLHSVDLAQGLAFGIAFWALVDEGMTWISGLAEPPQKYPWQAHARGLVGHLVYGLSAETTLDLLEAVAPRSSVRQPAAEAGD